jgi:hypothetical protein
MSIGDGFWTRSRVISALIVAAYMTLAAVFRGGEVAARLLLFCLLPLMCIWFPDYMGFHRGIGVSFPVVITEPSPSGCVFVLGWVVLFLPVVVVLIQYFGS